MSSNRFLRIALLISVGLSAAPLLFGLPPHEVAAEASHIAVISWALLLACAWLAGGVFRIRVRSLKLRLGSPAIVWLLMAVGFFYLSQDEVLRFHERMDDALNTILHLHGPERLDWIDDAIVGTYGLAALLVLRIYQRELRAVGTSVPKLVWGFGLMALMVALDAASNRPSFSLILTNNAGAARALRDWMGCTEEVLKVAAETFFLAAVYESRERARALIAPSPSPAGSAAEPMREPEVIAT
jgi:hypothetical protein